MSTWTSSALRAGLFGAVLAVSACNGFGPQAGNAVTPAERSVAVTGDRVVVTGPPGFCVDPTATRSAGDTAFVLMGNCAAISNSRRAAQPDTPAVLTASISAPSDGGSLRDSIPGLAAFFRTEEGRALLSRAQNPDTVEVLDAFHQGDVFFLHASDSSAGPVDGVVEDYWRAYLDLGPRIATLSVLGLEGQDFSDDDSLTLLRAFVSALSRANAGDTTASAPPPDPVQTAAAAPYGRPAAARLWNVGLFRRILR